MPKTSTMFTSLVLENIPKWVAAGLGREEIAARIGCKVSTLLVKCSQKKISLRRPIDPHSNLGRLELSASIKARLSREAAKMDIPVNDLIVLLVERIAEDDLFTAVLDVD